MPALGPRTITPAARELRTALGRNVCALTHAAGMSLNELANGAGVSRSHLGEVVCGRATCSLDWLTAIADVLRVDPAVLVTDTLPADAAADTE